MPPNSSGGVIGKMIDAKSIVVAGVATGQRGDQGEILSYGFWHTGQAAHRRVDVEVPHEQRMGTILRP